MADSLFSELTPEEKSLIERHYDFYRSLDCGERQPATEAQRHFVAVCQARARATTIHECAYVKHRMNLAKQRQRASSAAEAEVDEYGKNVPRPGWFTDRDWKRMRGQYLSNSE